MTFKTWSNRKFSSIERVRVSQNLYEQVSSKYSKFSDSIKAFEYFRLAVQILSTLVLIYKFMFMYFSGCRVRVQSSSSQV